MELVAGFVKYGHFLGVVATFCDKTVTKPAQMGQNPLTN